MGAIDRLARAERIGIVRTDHLGDMVLTLPLAHVLKCEYPHAHITMIAHSRTEALLDGCGRVDECWYIDRAPLGQILRQQKFDALFFPRAHADEVWTAWREHVPLRIGTAYRWWSPLYNVRIPDHRSRALYHEAEYNVRMLEYITGKRYEVKLVPPPIDPAAVARIDELLTERSGMVSYQPIIVLHPGGRGSAPRWHRFAELAALLREKIPSGVLIVTGTPDEQLLCATIAGAAQNVRNLCGHLTLRQLIALLSRSNVVVANSTGVLHIASALNIPVVGIYPSTPPSLSPRRWGPLTTRAHVITAQTIGDIEPGIVIAAIMDLLSPSQA